MATPFHAAAEAIAAIARAGLGGLEVDEALNHGLFSSSTTKNKGETTNAFINNYKESLYTWIISSPLAPNLFLAPISKTTPPSTPSFSSKFTSNSSTTTTTTTTTTTLRTDGPEHPPLIELENPTITNAVFSPVKPTMENHLWVSHELAYPFQGPGSENEQGGELSGPGFVPDHFATAPLTRIHPPPSTLKELKDSAQDGKAFVFIAHGSYRVDLLGICTARITKLQSAIMTLIAAEGHKGLSQPALTSKLQIDSRSLPQFLGKLLESGLVTRTLIHSVFFMTLPSLKPSPPGLPHPSQTPQRPSHQSANPSLRYALASHSNIPLISSLGRLPLTNPDLRMADLTAVLGPWVGVKPKLQQLLVSLEKQNIISRSKIMNGKTHNIVISPTTSALDTAARTAAVNYSSQQSILTSTPIIAATTTTTTTNTTAAATPSSSTAPHPKPSVANPVAASPSSSLTPSNTSSLSAVPHTPGTDVGTTRLTTAEEAERWTQVEHLIAECNGLLWETQLRALNWEYYAKNRQRERILKRFGLVRVQFDPERDGSRIRAAWRTLPTIWSPRALQVLPAPNVLFVKDPDSIDDENIEVQTQKAAKLTYAAPRPEGIVDPGPLLPLPTPPHLQSARFARNPCRLARAALTHIFLQEYLWPRRDLDPPPLEDPSFQWLLRFQPPHPEAPLSPFYNNPHPRTTTISMDTVMSTMPLPLVMALLGSSSQSLAYETLKFIATSPTVYFSSPELDDRRILMSLARDKGARFLLYDLLSDLQSLGLLKITTDPDEPPVIEISRMDSSPWHDIKNSPLGQAFTPHVPVWDDHLEEDIGVHWRRYQSAIRSRDSSLLSSARLFWLSPGLAIGITKGLKPKPPATERVRRKRKAPAVVARGPTKAPRATRRARYVGIIPSSLAELVAEYDVYAAATTSLLPQDFLTAQTPSFGLHRLSNKAKKKIRSFAPEDDEAFTRQAKEFLNPPQTSLLARLQQASSSFTHYRASSTAPLPPPSHGTHEYGPSMPSDVSRALRQFISDETSLVPELASPQDNDLLQQLIPILARVHETGTDGLQITELAGYNPLRHTWSWFDTNIARLYHSGIITLVRGELAWVCVSLPNSAGRQAPVWEISSELDPLKLAAVLVYLITDYPGISGASIHAYWREGLVPRSDLIALLWTCCQLDIIAHVTPVTSDPSQDPIAWLSAGYLPSIAPISKVSQAVFQDWLENVRPTFD